MVGPTHHYAGLSQGNIASSNNAFLIANPRLAALQGIDKMRYLHRLGLKQGVLPPHKRPNLELLSALGFSGTPRQQIQKVAKQAPHLLSICYSAASMWSANTATVSPSIDAQDGKVHFTAANLISNLHRAQEAKFSKYILEHIFNHPQYFDHHSIIPESIITGDEGAANHCRLARQHGCPGVNLFVFGQYGLRASPTRPQKYHARQLFDASQAITRQHNLDQNKVVFACQNPLAIDAGVFHNDVIAVANESVLLLHEQAFVNQPQILHELHRKADFDITILEIQSKDISLEIAIATYLFNSQLITLNDGSMILLSPIDCRENPHTLAMIGQLIADPTNPISDVHYNDLRQSMLNGGGPACLRLRVPLTANELAMMHQGVLVNDILLDQMTDWVNQYYRDSLHVDDLEDPDLIDESFAALDKLTKIIALGNIYPF